MTTLTPTPPSVSRSDSLFVFVFILFSILGFFSLYFKMFCCGACDDSNEFRVVDEKNLIHVMQTYDDGSTYKGYTKDGSVRHGQGEFCYFCLKSIHSHDLGRAASLHF